MTKQEAINATLDSVHLGYEDHGCWFISFQFKGSSWSQAMSITCDKPGSGFMELAISKALKVFGKSELRELDGLPARIIRFGGGPIDSFGHFLDDRWLELSELVREHQAKKEKA